MIDIDLQDPLGIVRANVGDANSEFVSDGTINSALATVDGDVNKASLIIMDMMLTAFSTLAEREREGQVEVYYTRLYERYKDRYSSLKRELGFKKAVPIFIGGTNYTDKKKIMETKDAFSLYQLPDWHNLQLSNKTVVEKELHNLTL